MESRRPQPLHLLLLPILTLLSLTSAQNNTGVALTNRYWDCCKPSCGWNGKAKFNHPVTTCDINDKPFSTYTEGTGCHGGTGYTCSNQSPWAVNDTFSYGFAGVYIKNHLEDFWCCACYELTFLSGNITGKKMIVQGTNSGYDVIGNSKFALAIPGGNTTAFDACATQYNVSASTFGQDQDGVATRSDCDSLPQPMRAGCYWRFDWLQATDRPDVNYTRVTCPAELTRISGCVRQDDKTFTQTGAGPTAAPARSVPVVAIAALLFGFLLS